MMKLSKATAHDDEDLKAFFSEQVIQGAYDYRLERPNSFFDQYKLSTDDYVTFVLRDGANVVRAMASILFKKAYVNSQEQTIGYVTDLRVSKSRKATLSWTKEFVPALLEEREKRGCQFVFSELEQYENIAYNTLLRRRNRSTRMPRYHLFRKFFLIAIFGRSVFSQPPLEGIRIDYGRTEDADIITRYLQEKSVRRPLRYNFSTEELERRCRTWPNFSLQNFIIARNYQDKVIGVMAPWNNRDVQRVIPHKYKDKSFQYYSTSNTLAPLGMTRPFSKIGEPLSLKHITHCAFDNADIFYSLLNRAYEDCQNKEILVYPNYFGDFAGRPPLTFSHLKIPYGFYTVLDNEIKLPQFLHPNPFEPSPDFEFVYF